MFIADPLVGPFEVPERFERLLRTPEVQRLREVRLINTTTPSLAGLSDVRRFTHTLAVLNLAHRAAEKLEWTWDRRSLDTLFVAAIVHDVGSPAFAHLFEYLLKSKFNFSHEAMLKSIIIGDYKRTNIFHQVYYGSQLALRECIEELGVDCDEVISCVLGGPPLGALIAGSLDIDNLDNVYRMAAGLGLQYDARSLFELADHMSIDVQSGMLAIPESHLSHIDSWRQLRRKSYEVIAFDEQALASQAMLTDCLSEAVGRNLLAEEDWFLTDEQMLRRLIELDDRAPLALRETVMRFATADYFSTVFVGWYQQSPSGDDLRLPEHRVELSGRLESALGISVSPYVFYDRGTFEKKIRLRVRDSSGSGEELSIGETSASTIVSIFTSQRQYRPSKREIERVQEILAQYGLAASSLVPLPDKRDVYGLAGRTQLAF